MTVEQIIKKHPELSKEDFGTYSDNGRDFVVLENSGRDKLQRKLEIYPVYTMPYYGEAGHAVIKASCNGIEMFGSVNPKTSNFPYFVEVAQRRALDRLVRFVAELGANAIGRDELPSSVVEVETNGKAKPAGLSQMMAEKILKDKEKNVKSISK